MATNDTVANSAPTTDHHLVKILLIGFVVFVLFVLIGLGIAALVWFIVKRHDNSSKKITTVVATNGGQNADGSNRMASYGGSGYTGTTPPTGLSCTQILNNNYAGYLIYNNSLYPQTPSVYGVFLGATNCMGVGITYSSPVVIASGASLWWKNNTITNNIYYTFYYNCIVQFTGTGAPSNLYATIPGSSTFDNTKYYMSITLNSNNTITTALQPN